MYMFLFILNLQHTIHKKHLTLILIKTKSFFHKLYEKYEIDYKLYIYRKKILLMNMPNLTLDSTLVNKIIV